MDSVHLATNLSMLVMISVRSNSRPDSFPASLLPLLLVVVLRLPCQPARCLPAACVVPPAPAAECQVRCCPACNASPEPLLRSMPHTLHSWPALLASPPKYWACAHARCQRAVGLSVPAAAATAPCLLAQAPPALCLHRAAGLEGQAWEGCMTIMSGFALGRTGAMDRTCVAHVLLHGGVEVFPCAVIPC